MLTAKKKGTLPLAAKQIHTVPVKGPKVVVVAGTQSGCGKTLVSLALMAACVQRGLTVQAFKAGPDFIDPGHHALVTGRKSHNLDGWILGKEPCLDVFARYAAPDSGDAPDICIVEGVMGLFDGASGKHDAGSTAQLAKWLDAPVLLVVDARSMARSVAALVHGYTTLDPELDFAGVLCNRVGSANHEQLVSEALRAYCPSVPLRGCLPRHATLATPSRHLGLLTAEEAPLAADRQQEMAAWIEHAVDLDALLAELPVWAPPPSIADNLFAEQQCEYIGGVRIGVARDEAFCFYYQENLRLLEACGAELAFFSPLHDSTLPENIAGLYLGGGYPELHARALAANTGMLGAVRSAIASALPVYAECGGFMYLTQGVVQQDDTSVASNGERDGHAESRHALVGHFPVWCAMQARFRALGYREVRTNRPSLLGPVGTTARGHEFHYSFLLHPELLADDALYVMADRKGPVTTQEGFSRGSVLASYVHLHFQSNPEIPRVFVRACSEAYTDRT